MSWIDLAIAGAIAWPTFTAFRTGLIRQIVSLASVIAGGLAASRLYDRLSANIDFLIADPQLRNLASFVAIFAGCIVIGQVVGMLARSVASLLFLGPIDHIGGAVFGFVQGVLSAAFLLFALTAFPAVGPVTEALAQSRIAPIFLNRLPLLERLLPGDFREALNTFGGEIPLPEIPSLPSGIPGIQ